MRNFTKEHNQGKVIWDEEAFTLIEEKLNATEPETSLKYSDNGYPRCTFGWEIEGAYYNYIPYRGKIYIPFNDPTKWLGEKRRHL